MFKDKLRKTANFAKFASETKSLGIVKPLSQLKLRNFNYTMFSILIINGTRWTWLFGEWGVN